MFDSIDSVAGGYAMPLTLVIAGPQRQAPGHNSLTLTACGARIGRAADNDWVLADPERVISARHCLIDFIDGGYCLTDLSTNGVYLNGAETRLEPGRRVGLRDGDRFALGTYDIDVYIVPEPAPPALPTPPATAILAPFMQGVGLPDVLPDERELPQVLYHLGLLLRRSVEELAALHPNAPDTEGCLRALLRDADDPQAAAVAEAFHTLARRFL